MSKKTVGILGFGEVGKAVYTLAKAHFNVLVRDIDKDEFGQGSIHTLHICIPYTAKFMPVVVAAIKEVKPKLVIIDATVKPGTTREIYQKTKVLIVHAPIDGVHPHLAKYQTVFTKTIGAINDEAYKEARAHWKKLGAPKVVRFDSPEDTEMAKIISTTYYGWNIVFNKLIHTLCAKTHTNFDQVYTEFTKIYNAGYAQSKPNVQKPLLTYSAGKIGGHCVIPNAQILFDSYKDPTIKWMLEFNEQLESTD